MNLTVLGKSPSWQDADGACSGYLVEEAGTALLLDCGNGVFAKLRARRDYGAIAAVLITHLHADHFLDLVPYAYGLTYGPFQGSVKPVLHAPPGARETFRRVVGAWGNEDLIEAAFDLREYAVDDVLAVGPLTMRFAHVPHYTDTHAVDITAAAGARMTFGADCAPNDALPALARDTPLLLVEATLPEPETGDVRGHMTAREAAEMAARAGAATVVLTHRSDQLDDAVARAEAHAVFGGRVEIASEGAVFTL